MLRSWRAVTTIVMAAGDGTERRYPIRPPLFALQVVVARAEHWVAAAMTITVEPDPTLRVRGQ
jgi:hypothetical protein